MLTISTQAHVVAVLPYVSYSERALAAFRFLPIRPCAVCRRIFRLPDLARAQQSSSVTTLLSHRTDRSALRKFVEKKNPSNKTVCARWLYICASVLFINTFVVVVVLLYLLPSGGYSITRWQTSEKKGPTKFMLSCRMTIIKIK